MVLLFPCCLKFTTNLAVLKHEFISSQFCKSEVQVALTGFSAFDPTMLRFNSRVILDIKENRCFEMQNKVFKHKMILKINNSTECNLIK